MSNLFVTGIHIDKVRHLENIDIQLNKENFQHLIFTGKNGSGKTSVLEAIKSYISMYTSKDALSNIRINDDKSYFNERLKEARDKNDKLKVMGTNNVLKSIDDQYNQFYRGLTIDFPSEADIIESFSKGDFIVAFYAADRKYIADIAKHIEKIELSDFYEIQETPGKKMVQYLLDLKTTSALAEKAGNFQKSKEIDNWFTSFEQMLREIFEDEHLRLEFDIESFQFTIIESNREPFDFNTLSSGYAAILDIIVDIMLRMEKKKNRFYELPGVVLIDEIETHLHIALQKKILPFLTKTFPNIQFIVTTHSPFILNSIKNTLIYDLENKTAVSDLSAYSYEGIVEYYYNSDMYSDEIKKEFETYKKLIDKPNRTEEESEQLINSIQYLKQIPSNVAEELVYTFREMEEKRRGRFNDKNH